MSHIEAWLADRAHPSQRSRIVVSVLIGLLGLIFCYVKYVMMPEHPGDFGLSWFGARAMLSERNPYALVGPGLAYDWPWPLVYPGTAFVVALPLAHVKLLAANLAFVFVSSALLAYSVTEDGWSRLPLFGSSAFIVAAGAAQWSPLFTAALGIPVLAFFFAAKPTIGLALCLARPRELAIPALVGGIIITGVSLFLFPAWPALWLRQLHYATQMAPPFLRPGGFFILLALLRWNRPEARLLIALAVIPQVGSWYEALPVFAVTRTYKETMGLSIASLIGFHLGGRIPASLDETQINQAIGGLMVAFVYLPAIIIILNRPVSVQRAASPSRYVYPSRPAT